MAVTKSSVTSLVGDEFGGDEFGGDEFGGDEIVVPRKGSGRAVRAGPTADCMGGGLFERASLGSSDPFPGDSSKGLVFRV